MRYFPAATRPAFESPHLPIPAEFGCGVVRRHLWTLDQAMPFRAADEHPPIALPHRSEPSQRART